MSNTNCTLGVKITTDTINSIDKLARLKEAIEQGANLESELAKYPDTELFIIRYVTRQGSSYAMDAYLSREQAEAALTRFRQVSPQTPLHQPTGQRQYYILEGSVAELLRKTLRDPRYGPLDMIERIFVLNYLTLSILSAGQGNVKK